jgi:hypothetical protein
MVSPVEVAHEHIPLLVQVILVLWDHYTPVVQDQAREMLVHLIHELVISKIDDDTVGIDKKSIEDFVEGVRQHDVKVVKIQMTAAPKYQSRWCTSPGKS